MIKDLGLITDRTQKDLENDTDRAYIAYTDLNRIGEAISYLTEQLTAVGYTVSTSPKTDWEVTDIRDQANMDILQKDLRTIREVLPAMATTPDVPVVKFDSIRNANEIEKILADAQILIDGIIMQYRYCGDGIIAGEEIAL